MTVVILVAPPAGTAYNFIVNLYTYPGAWINAFVAGGLLYLQFSKAEKWSSPWHSWPPVTVLYLLAMLFLALVPFIPPEGDWNAEGYPFYVFPVVGVGVLLLGAVYWLCWTKVWPAVGGYRIVAERHVDEDGAEVVRYKKLINHAHAG